MGNPRNRLTNSYAPNRPSVGATSSGDRGTADTRIRRKRVRFAQEADCSIEPEPDVKAKPTVDETKTSEYAFFKKLRLSSARKKDLPVHKESNSNRADESKSGDDSDNAGVGHIINQSFQSLKFSLNAPDVGPAEASVLLSPTDGSSKHAEMNSVEQPDFRVPEFEYPIKKARHVDFDVSCSPFRDQLRSAVAGYAYGQGNIFSTKRDKLLQLVANTYPESKNLNEVDLVSSMLRRLFPNACDSKHFHGAHKLRLQDTCTSWSPGLLENSADCEEFCWSGHGGSGETGDLMLLDYGCTSSGCTELAKWSADYSTPPDSSGSEHFHYKMKKPYQISDSVGCRSPWTKYFPSCSPCETFVSPASSDIVSHHPDDLPSKQTLLLGWVDEKTGDRDQLQIAPYRFDYGKSSHSDFQTSWKSDYQVSDNIDSRLSRIPHQSVSSHYGNLDGYLHAIKDTEYLTSDNHLGDRENKSWDIIHLDTSSSYYTNKDGGSNLPYLNVDLLQGSPNMFATGGHIPSDCPRGQIMSIDNQHWEVFGTEVASPDYLGYDCHCETGGGYQTGYTGEPSYGQTTYPIFPLDLDMEGVPSRLLDGFLETTRDKGLCYSSVTKPSRWL